MITFSKFFAESLGDTEVIKNPTHREFANILKTVDPGKTTKSVRTLIDPDSGDVYMWGEDRTIYATHNMMMHRLGMRLTPAYLWVERGRGVFWRIAEWSGDYDRDQPLMENPKGAMLRYIK